MFFDLNKDTKNPPSLQMEDQTFLL